MLWSQGHIYHSFEKHFCPLIDPDDGNRSCLRNARFYPISDAAESRQYFIDPKDLTVSHLGRRQSGLSPLLKLQLRHTLFSFQGKRENMF
jgi:hypothetical protein